MMVKRAALQKNPDLCHHCASLLQAHCRMADTVPRINDRCTKRYISGSWQPDRSHFHKMQQTALQVLEAFSDEGIGIPAHAHYECMNGARRHRRSIRKQERKRHRFMLMKNCERRTLVHPAQSLCNGTH